MQVRYVLVRVGERRMNVNMRVRLRAGLRYAVHVLVVFVVNVGVLVLEQLVLVPVAVDFAE